MRVHEALTEAIRRGPSGPMVGACFDLDSTLLASFSATASLGRFKAEDFRMAMQAGVPSVPVVFRNVLDALPRHAVVLRPATSEALALPPVDPANWSKQGLAAEMTAIRQRYRDVLGR